jgi:DhnA family fructose-bisphosphate aldolase class Ia
MMIITTNQCWLVGKQFETHKERFTNKQDAEVYANKLARKLGGDIVEVFVCCNNIMAAAPVVEVQESSVEVKL